MKFNRNGQGDDLLFLIVIALPAIVAAARFFESEHEKDLVAQGREASQLAARQRHEALDRLHVAEVQGDDRATGAAR
jgi:hypothetical protein